MVKKDKIEILVNAVRRLGADVKADVLLNHAIEEGFPDNGFTVSNSRFFHREYAKDIYSGEIIEDNWYRRFIEFQLTRPGFYDMLPEALFHQPDTAEFRQHNGVAEMAGRYKQNLVKEREARKFFQPVENEIFHHQMMIEKEEISFLNVLNNRFLIRFFTKFWQLPGSLTLHETASLLLILPHATTIKGNLPLMAACLSALLNEKVSISLKESPTQVVTGIDDFGLGSRALGDTMVCGNEFEEDYPVLDYKIGPLLHSKVIDYIENGKKDIVIKTFNNYFAPVEADLIIEIEVPAKHAGMSMDEEEGIVLGYATVL